MLYTFGFERIAVAVGDLYFEDPRGVTAGGDPEIGVRLEVRFLEAQPLKGSPYSARPIAIDRPIWRADLLETVSQPGTMDKSHHHPRFRGWEPGRRTFDEAMSSDPVAWVGKRLTDLHGLLEEAGVPVDEVHPNDSEELRRAVPEIVDAIERLLTRIRAGELAQPPDERDDSGTRLSWL